VGKCYENILGKVPESPKLKKLKKIENTCTLEEKVFATFYTPRASSFGAVHNEFNIPGKDDGDAYSLMNYYFTLKPWQIVGRQTLVKAKFVKKAFNSNKKKKKKMPPRLTCLFGDHALFMYDSFNIKSDKNYALSSVCEITLICKNNITWYKSVAS